MPATYRQSVPRPPDARPGSLAPWSGRPPAERAAVSLERLRRALTGLPPAPAEPVDSAVLVPVAERQGQATLVFIRRAGGLARDPGHIAFPGGHLEADERPLDAALRESQEEIGLDPNLVEVLGSFGVIERRRRGDRVVPIVGIVPGELCLVPDRHEVAAILEVPVASLAGEGVFWQERWGPPGADVGVCFFAGTPELADDLIWGLTAHIVWDLLTAIFTET